MDLHTLEVSITGIASVVTAIGSAIALQVSEIGWAADFLVKYGWLGLFVLSAGLNAFLFKQIVQGRKDRRDEIDEMRRDHKRVLESERQRFDREIETQRSRFEREIERAQMQLQSATNQLIEEYRLQITKLSSGGN